SGCTTRWGSTPRRTPGAGRTRGARCSRATPPGCTPPSPARSTCRCARPGRRPTSSSRTPTSNGRTCGPGTPTRNGCGETNPRVRNPAGPSSPVVEAAEDPMTLTLQDIDWRVPLPEIPAELPVAIVATPSYEERLHAVRTLHDRFALGDTVELDLSDGIAHASQ